MPLVRGTVQGTEVAVTCQEPGWREQSGGCCCQEQGWMVEESQSPGLVTHAEALLAGVKLQRDGEAFVASAHPKMAAVGSSQQPERSSHDHMH